MYRLCYLDGNAVRAQELTPNNPDGWLIDVEGIKHHKFQRVALPTLTQAIEAEEEMCYAYLEAGKVPPVVVIQHPVRIPLAMVA